MGAKVSIFGDTESAFKSLPQDLPIHGPSFRDHALARLGQRLNPKVGSHGGHIGHVFAGMS